MNAYSFQKPHEKILTPLSLGVNVRDFRRAARNRAVTKRQRQRYSSLRLPGKHGGFLPDLPHVSALFLPACFLSILHTRARAISQKHSGSTYPLLKSLTSFPVFIYLNLLTELGPPAPSGAGCRDFSTITLYNLPFAHHTQLGWPLVAPLNTIPASRPTSAVHSASNAFPPFHMADPFSNMSPWPPHSTYQQSTSTI